MELVQKELKEIKQFIKEQNILRKEILTLDEVSLYLGQSKSSIYKLTSRREIPFYSPGGKIKYFRKSELEQWIFSSKVSTIEEFESEANDYLGRTSKINKL